jgi:hypothetical protein
LPVGFFLPRASPTCYRFSLSPLVAGNFKEITMSEILEFLMWLASNTWHVLLMLALVAGAFVAESIFGLGDE